MRPLLVFVLLALCLVAPGLGAEPPYAAWRTLETEHFRFHYPEPWEDWARKLAGQAEPVAAEIGERVGYRPDTLVDVVVADPFAAPGGFAIPLPGRSRTALFSTPPGSDHELSHFGDYPELLFAHEYVHIAHLSRPLRRQPDRFLAQVWFPAGLEPLAGVPFWALEGYATWLETELTGSGRPDSDLTVAIIRHRALAGELPGYERIASRADGWQEGQLAYTFGAAFFDWLADKHGEESFARVWARYTAREPRSFDQAFEGVFGARPRVLYQRFLAEATHGALEAEQAAGDKLVEGEIWQAFEWNTGRPAVSPDGEYVAVVVRDRNRASVLRVFRLDDNEEAFKRWERRQERKLEADPEDVKAVKPDSLPRSSRAELPARQGEDMHHVRWTDDGESLVFTRRSPGFEGFRHSDVWRWDIGADRLQRVTRRADLHRPDPIPGADQAVAVRYRHGYSQLVLVDLDKGAVEPLSERELDVIHDQPRVAPDGERLVYMRHEAGQWRLVLRSLSTGEEEILKRADAGAYLTEPAWAADGERIYFTAGREGYVNLHEMRPDGSDSRALTRMLGVPSGAAPVPGEDLLLYRSLHARGWNLHLLELDREVPEEALPARAAWGPVVRPESREPRVRETEAVEDPDRPYGIGARRASAMLGYRWAHSDYALDLGIKGGDLVGRLDWNLAASGSRRGSANGAAANLRWRGWLADFEGGVYREDLDPGEQRETAPELPAVWEETRTGAWMGSRWVRRLRPGGVNVGGGVARMDFDGPEGDGNRSWIYADAEQFLSVSRGDWGFRQLMEVSGMGGGSKDGDGENRDWNEWRLGLGLAFGYGESEILLRGRRAKMDGEAEDGEALRLGGQPGTVGTPRNRPFQRFEPALPAGALWGNYHESQTLRIGSSEGGFFWRRHRMDDEDFGQGEWLNLRGLEVEARLDNGLFLLPELRGTSTSFGVAQVIPDSGERTLRGWVNLHYRF